MKKNLEILDYEDKKSQAGKRFVRFKTSEGWMSCFDTTASDALKELEGRTASVEVVQSGEFFNIKKCYGIPEDKDMNEVEVEKIGRPSENKDFPKSKNSQASMYVSYAKDIFCAVFKGHEEEDPKQIMEQSINLVKQAKEAFE